MYSAITSSNEDGLSSKNFCYSDNNLFPNVNLKDFGEYTEVESDKSEISGKNIYSLNGNVKLGSKEYFLSSDEVTINKEKNNVIAKHNVQYQDQDISFTASDAEIKKINNEKILSATNSSFFYPESLIRGDTKFFSGNKNLKVFNDASYTKCPLNSNAWKISSDKITLNSVTNRGNASNTVLTFFDLPIFYSPTFEWVLRGRGSGFLAPSLSSYKESATNSDEIQAITPYYFNLAPDRDLILSLHSLSSRGEGIEADYRTLINNKSEDKAQFKVLYFDKDHISKESRWKLNTNINYQYDEHTSVLLKTNRVSDKNFFKEILNENTSAKSIFSNIKLAYSPPEYNLELYAEHEQLINNGTPSYVKSGELNFRDNFTLANKSNLDLGFSTTNFEHSDFSKIDGNRSHIDITLNNSSLKNLAYSVIPSLKLISTKYNLSDGSTPSRNLYSFQLDSTLNLERELNFSDNEIIQTFTPKISYKYTPKKDQSSIPLLDSEAKTNLDNILSPDNSFHGIDRISNANDITLSLNSEFFNARNGETYLNLNLNQKYFLDDQRLNSDGTFETSRKYSNIATIADANYDQLSLNNRLEFDPEIASIVRSSSSVSYILNSRQFISLNYFDEGEESISIYGAYPISRNLHLFGGINKSLTNSQTNRLTAGIAFDSCCWAARVTHFNDSGKDRTNSFELVFKGLSSTSPSIATKIQDRIPFYNANLDNLND